MTIALFLNDTYLFHSTAKIIKSGQDDKGKHIILDRTIFYPQGGGQPSDQGFIKLSHNKIEVYFVKQIENSIYHYVNELTPDWLDKDIELIIDEQLRLLNARYHTAAHLLGNIVEQLYPELKAVKGHSFPNEAYVEFNNSNNNIELEYLEDKLNYIILQKRSTSVFEISPLHFEEKFYKLPYTIPGSKNFRAMQIEGFLPVPCGGTHLKNIFEIGTIKLSKVSSKEGKTKISYKIL